MTMQWVVLRVVSGFQLWVQAVRYASSPPAEGDVKAVGDFLAAYPPPGVAGEQLAPFVYELLEADTALPITENPATETKRTIFDAAIAEENLGTKFYPLLMFPAQGVNTVTVPLWTDANVGFYDELQAMSEGSSV